MARVLRSSTVRFRGTLATFLVSSEPPSRRGQGSNPPTFTTTVACGAFFLHRSAAEWEQHVVVMFLLLLQRRSFASGLLHSPRRGLWNHFTALDRCAAFPPPSHLSTGIFSCSALCTSACTRIARAYPLFPRTSRNAGPAHAQRMRRLHRLPALCFPALHTIHQLHCALALAHADFAHARHTHTTAGAHSDTATPPSSPNHVLRSTCLHDALGRRFQSPRREIYNPLLATAP